MLVKLKDQVENAIGEFFEQDLSPENHLALLGLPEIIRNCNPKQLSKLINGILKRGAELALLCVIDSLNEDFETFQTPFEVNLGLEIPNFEMFKYVIGADISELPTNPTLYKTRLNNMLLEKTKTEWRMVFDNKEQQND